MSTYTTAQFGRLMAGLLRKSAAVEVLGGGDRPRYRELPGAAPTVLGGTGSGRSASASAYWNMRNSQYARRASLGSGWAARQSAVSPSVGRDMARVSGSSWASQNASLLKQHPQLARYASYFEKNPKAWSSFARQAGLSPQPSAQQARPASVGRTVSRKAGLASGPSQRTPGTQSVGAPSPAPQARPANRSPYVRQYSKASRNYASGGAQTPGVVTWRPGDPLPGESGQPASGSGSQGSQRGSSESSGTCPTCHRKLASATPSAPPVPNAAPRPIKTPSYTTTPPSISRASADVRAGLASTVTPKIQSLGTAKAPSAGKTTVTRSVMTPSEFRRAAPAVPLAKSAQSVVYGGGGVPLIDTRKWSKADWRRWFGLAAAAPFAAASVPAAVGGGAAAAGGALTGAILSGVGGYGAGTGAFDAADAVRRGDYGGAVRSGAGAVMSAGFGAAGKVPKAMAAAKGAAGALGLTDLIRAAVYARNGMGDAAGNAAAGALSDATMFIPGGRFASRLLQGAGMYVASPFFHTREQISAADALDRKLLSAYEPASAKALQASSDALRSGGVDVKPLSGALSADAAERAADAFEADTPAADKAYAGRSWSRRFMSGLLGTEGLDAVKAREGLVGADGLTPGGRSAADAAASDAAAVAPDLRAAQDHQRSWRGKLDRALGWAWRHKGLTAAGAGAGVVGGLLLWRALAARRRRREEERGTSVSAS